MLPACVSSVFVRSCCTTTNGTNKQTKQGSRRSMRCMLRPPGPVRSRCQRIDERTDCRSGQAAGRPAGLQSISFAIPFEFLRSDHPSMLCKVWAHAKSSLTRQRSFNTASVRHSPCQLTDWIPTAGNVCNSLIDGPSCSFVPFRRASSVCAIARPSLARRWCRSGRRTNSVRWRAGETDIDGG